MKIDLKYRHIFQQFFFTIFQVINNIKEIKRRIINKFDCN